MTSFNIMFVFINAAYQGSNLVTSDAELFFHKYISSILNEQDKNRKINIVSTTYYCKIEQINFNRLSSSHHEICSHEIQHFAQILSHLMKRSLSLLGNSVKGNPLCISDNDMFSLQHSNHPSIICMSASLKTPPALCCQVPHGMHS